MVVFSAGVDSVPCDGNVTSRCHSFFVDFTHRNSGVLWNDKTDIISTLVPYGFAMNECIRIEVASRLRAVARPLMNWPLIHVAGIPCTLYTAPEDVEVDSCLGEDEGAVTRPETTVESADEDGLARAM